MKLRYGYAIVSFCPDLTHATTPSVPLAGLILGETEEGEIAIIANLQIAPDAFDDDPISAAVLSDLPKLLREHVDEAFTEAPELRSVDGVLRRLHNALRNSLHVSTISKPMEMEIEDTMKVPTILVDQVMSALSKAMKEEAGKVAEVAARPARPERRPTPGPRPSAMPDLHSWRRPRVTTEVHAD
jgi:hypothetical protein